MIPAGVAATKVGVPWSRRDGADDAVLVDLLGKRQLTEDPGHALVRVELGDEPEKLLLGRLG